MRGEGREEDEGGGEKVLSFSEYTYDLMKKCYLIVLSVFTNMI